MYYDDWLTRIQHKLQILPQVHCFNKLLRTQQISWTSGSDMGHFQYNVTNHSDYITIESQIAGKAKMKIKQNNGNAG